MVNVFEDDYEPEMCPVLVLTSVPVLSTGKYWYWKVLGTGSTGFCTATGKYWTGNVLDWN